MASQHKNKIRSPVLGLYNEIYKICELTGYPVYDDLPDDTAPYPFIIIGQVQEQASDLPYGQGANLTINIDIWGTEDNRPEINKISSYLMLLDLVKANGYVYQAKHDLNSFSTMIDDTVPSTDLIHGMLELHFRYTR